jgi:isocitrate/isopropylmalate dehydrogenase
MLLDHEGEHEAADQIQAAIKKVIADGKVRTKDMGGSNTTSEVGEAIVKEFLAS